MPSERNSWSFKPSDWLGLLVSGLEPSSPAAPGLSTTVNFYSKPRPMVTHTLFLNMTGAFFPMLSNLGD